MTHANAETQTALGATETTDGRCCSTPQQELATSLAHLASALRDSEGIEFTKTTLGWRARHEIEAASETLSEMKNLIREASKGGDQRTSTKSLEQAKIYRYPASATVELLFPGHVETHTFVGPVRKSSRSRMVPAMAYALARTPSGEIHLGGKAVFLKKPELNHLLAYHQGRLPKFIVAPQALPHAKQQARRGQRSGVSQ